MKNTENWPYINLYNEFQQTFVILVYNNIKEKNIKEYLLG